MKYHVSQIISSHLITIATIAAIITVIIVSAHVALMRHAILHLVISRWVGPTMRMSNYTYRFPIRLIAAHITVMRLTI